MNHHLLVSAAPRPGLVVMCAGMRRGGSTMQCQLAADIVGVEDMYPVSAEIFVKSCASFQHQPVVVFKTHEFISEVAKIHSEGHAKIFYIFRDVRDVIVSFMEKSKKSFDQVFPGTVKLVLAEYSAWTSLNGIHIAKYEDVLCDTPGEIARMASYLQTDIQSKDIQAIADKRTLAAAKIRIRTMDWAVSGVGSGTNTYDPKSLLHFNHISSGEIGRWRKQLNNFQVACVEALASDWLIKNGYEIASSEAARRGALKTFSICKRFKSLSNGAIRHARRSLRASW